MFRVINLLNMDLRTKFWSGLFATALLLQIPLRRGLGYFQISYRILVRLFLEQCKSSVSGSVHCFLKTNERRNQPVDKRTWNFSLTENQKVLLFNDHEIMSLRIVFCFWTEHCTWENDRFLIFCIWIYFIWNKF